MSRKVVNRFLEEELNKLEQSDDGKGRSEEARERECVCVCVCEQ